MIYEFKYGKLKQIDQRTVEYSPIKGVYLDGNNLCYGDKPIFSQNGIGINGITFKPNIITKDANTYTLKECRYNKLSILGLPIVLRSGYLSDSIRQYLYNVYTNRDCSICYIVMRLNDSDKYMKIDSNFIEYKNCQKVENLGNNLISFNFDLTNSQTKTFKVLMRGRYSKLLDVDKTKILKYHNDNSKIFNIISPNKTALRNIAKSLDVDQHLIREVASRPIGEYIEEI